MSFERAFLSGAVAVALTAAVACGGSQASDLFGDPGSTGSNPDAATPPLVDASIPEDTSASIVDAPPDPTDTSPAPDVAVKDVGAPDTHVDPIDPGIACGASECKPGGLVCCRIGTGMNPSFACIAPGGCQQISAFSIPCDDADDCDTAGHPGDVCCVTANQQTGAAQEVRCRAPKDCVQSTQTTLCDPSEPDPCPDGGTCRESKTTIPGYWICVQ
jgi:hypothetical protein